MANGFSTHEEGIQQDNFLAKILSFLNPQDNKRRLQEMGAPGYAMAEPPEAPQAPMQVRGPTSSAATALSFGLPAGGPEGAPETGAAPGQPSAPTPEQSPRMGTTPPIRAPRSGDMFVDRGETGISPNGMYDARVARAIITQYIDAGYDPRFAAGMAANAMIESGGNPTAYNKSEGAFGLFQHRLDRLDNMRSFANRLGMDVNDISTQVSFSMHEFMAAEKAAYGQIMGGDPQSAADYARLIDQYYERSDGAARDKRAALASEIYGDFFGEGGAYANDQPILNFGEEIDPYGVQDNVARMRAMEFGLDPSMLDMGTTEPLGPIADYALGEPVGGEVTAPAVPTSEDYPIGTPVETGGGSAPVPASQAGGGATPVEAPEPVDTSPGALAGFLDKIYGTTDLTDDERRMRRKAIGEAFVEGLNYLTRGQADMAGVFARIDARRSEYTERELAQAEKAKAAAQADAVAQMATNMGLGQIAGLAYMGDAAKNSLTQAMVSSMSSKGTKDQYDLDPENREILAARAAELGRDDLASTIRTGNGKALEDAATALFSLKGPEEGEGGPSGSSAGLADWLATNGAPEQLVGAMRAAGSAAEQSNILDQAVADRVVPSSLQKEWEFLQGLDPAQRAQALELVRAGAGGAAATDQRLNVVQAPVLEGAKQYAEKAGQYATLGQIAEGQNRQFANPALQTNALKSLVEPVARVLRPLNPELFDSLGLDEQNLLATRNIDALKDYALSFVAADVPGALSNREGDRLTAVLGSGADTRTQGLALTQFIKRQVERGPLLNDVRANFLALPPEEQTSQRYAAMQAEVLNQTPIYRELDWEDYKSQLQAAGPMNDMPLSQRGEVVAVRMPDGAIIYRTFGIYPEEEK